MAKTALVAKTIKVEPAVWDEFKGRTSLCGKDLKQTVSEALRDWNKKQSSG